jgi:uncharacterized protein (TIGR02246 family)
MNHRRLKDSPGKGNLSEAGRRLLGECRARRDNGGAARENFSISHSGGQTMAGRTIFCARSLVSGLASLAIASLLLPSPARGQDDAVVAAIRASDEAFVKAFNSGKTAELAGAFVPQGELIDEEGTVYQGTKEIHELFTKFFEKYPGCRLELTVESIRPVGANLAIEEGTRYVEAAKGEGRAQLRYTAVRVKAPDGKWQIASIREFNDDPLPTPHEHLEALSWLVGDWVNEGTDAAVKLTYRWSEEGNFILGDLHFHVEGKLAMKSTQRIGWDPLTGKVRSWLFDGDGGFSDGTWTPIDDGWVIKSSSVNPDGSTGTATLTVTPSGKDRYVMKGTDRIVGDAREPDFEFVVTRQPPQPGK